MGFARADFSWDASDFSNRTCSEHIFSIIQHEGSVAQAWTDNLCWVENLSDFPDLIPEKGTRPGSVKGFPQGGIIRRLMGRKS